MVHLQIVRGAKAPRVQPQMKTVDDSMMTCLKLIYLQTSCFLIFLGISSTLRPLGSFKMQRCRGIPPYKFSTRLKTYEK